MKNVLEFSKDFQSAFWPLLPFLSSYKAHTLTTSAKTENHVSFLTAPYNDGQHLTPPGESSSSSRSKT